MIEKFKSWYRALPEKKRYLEFFTALLTVPVLLTVIILNISALQNNRRIENAIIPTPAPTGVPSIITIIEKNPAKSDETKLNESTPSTIQCRKTVGPVEINYPGENETINKNPVCINISYNSQDYCSVVWSYRINNDTWSEYTDKSICIYNMDPGDKKLELRVRSIASEDEILLRRSFTVTGPTPTPQNATGSGIML